MKKATSIVLVTIQVLFHSKGHAQNIDMEKFMRNAKDIIHKETTVTVPAAIASQYSESIKIKTDYLHNVIKNYSSSLEYLRNSFQQFDFIYDKLNLDSINNINSYKNLLSSINELDKLKDNSRNAIYTYRSAESDLVSLKDSFKDYCETTSSMVNAKGLVLEPLPYSLSDFKPSLGNFNEELSKDGDIKNTFLGAFALGGISGFGISVAIFGFSKTIGMIKIFFDAGTITLGATGWGALVVVSLVTIALVTAWFVHKDKQKKEQERIEKLKREVMQRYEEAVAWFQNNTILKKPEKITQMAFDFCSSPTNMINVLNKKTNQLEPISIHQFKANLENEITTNLNLAYTANGNVQYTSEQNLTLKDLFKFENGNIVDPQWYEYKDTITSNYLNMEEKIAHLKKIVATKRNEIASILAKKDVELIKKRLDSSEKLSQAAEIIFQQIGTQNARKLFQNYIHNRDSCKKFKKSNEEIINEIEILKNIVLTQYQDDFNKEEPLFTENLPNLLESIYNAVTIRTKRICKG